MPTPAADTTLGALSVTDKSPEGLTHAAAQAVTALAHVQARLPTPTRGSRRRCPSRERASGKAGQAAVPGL